VMLIVRVLGTPLAKLLKSNRVSMLRWHH
jgi:hypothetical protein